MRTQRGLIQLLLLKVERKAACTFKCSPFGFQLILGEPAAYMSANGRDALMFRAQDMPGEQLFCKWQHHGKAIFRACF